MSDQESSAQAQSDHSYLDVGASGPRRLVLLIGALLLILALVAAFYGLYTINQAPSPTLSPNPAALTLVPNAAVPPPDSSGISSGATSAVVESTPIPTGTMPTTATSTPPTVTVQQGDSLITIASRLNVNVNDLVTLNQLGNETIFPNQVLLVPPTVTPWPASGPFPHTVIPGETLLSIAGLYNVTVEALKTLNGLTSDIIFSEQQILIPANGVRPPTPTPTLEPWQPAIITGELEIVYSLAMIKGHFTLHIPPDTRAATANESAKIAGLVETALHHANRVLNRQFNGRVEVFVADTPFAAPFTSRRSFSLLDQKHLFLLYNGSGTPTERLYFVTYGLAPLVTAQMLGAPASPLLGEGLAVYAAGQALSDASGEGRGYLLPIQFCTALQQAGQLPPVSRQLTLDGHLGYLDQHLAAGCFVNYLVKTEGMAAFSQIYLSGDYSGVYGQTIAQLESSWIASLQAAAGDLPLDALELARLLTAVNAAYRRLWAGFEGTPTQFAAYERLDRARLALLQGRLGAVQEHLRLFETLLGGQ